MTAVLALSILLLTGAGVKAACPGVCVENGAVNVNGDEATITCVAGYALDGASKLNCGSDGAWSAAIPSCKKVVFCDGIMGIDRGRAEFSSNHNSVGGTVTFECNTGYQLTGPSKITCLSSGKWDYTEEPVCKYASCLPFNSFAHGNITEQNIVQGGEVKFECDKGYKMKGQDTLTCAADNKWNAEAPECEEFRCPHIKFVPNGSLKGYSNLVGGEAEFECNEGYKLKDSAKITCNDNAQWSAATPSCVRDDSISDEAAMKLSTFESCPFFNLENGQCRGKRTVGKATTCKCHDGYKMNVSGKLTCTKDLEFKGKIPECREEQCPTIYYVDHAKVKSPSKPPYATGKKMSVECGTGYERKGGKVMTCQKDGHWSHMPTCKFQACNHRGLHFPNGQVSGYNNRRKSGPIKFVCNPGYKFPGGEKRIIMRCKTKVMWSKPIPKCVPVKTCNVPCLANGHFTEVTKKGNKTVRYTCNSGYKLQGAAKRYCLDGDWSTDAPTCIEDTSAGIVGVAAVGSTGTQSAATGTCQIGNYYYIVDLSKSIRNSSLVHIRVAIKSSWEELEIGEDKVQVALIKYGRKAEVEIPLGFYNTTKKLQDAEILTRGKDVRGGTSTGAAMRKMMELVKQDSKPGRPNVAILFTDGKATDKIDDMIKDLHNHQPPIKVIAIGIGKDANETNRELKAIAGEGNVHIINKMKKLSGLIPTITSNNCPLPPTTTTTTTTTTATPVPTTSDGFISAPVKPLDECVDVIADIMFCVDVSRSIDDEELKQEREALRHFILNFDIKEGGSRIGVVMFYRIAETEIELGQYATRDELEKVKLLQRGDLKDLKGGTSTGQGLNESVSAFDRNDRKRVIIVLTDGKATEELGQTIRALPDTILRIAVGIGKKANEDELSSIASGENSENVHIVKKMEELQTVAATVVKATCSAVGNKNTV